MNTKTYVFPHFAPREKQIQEIEGLSRLFAYPATPSFKNKGRITILDSGAFALSCKNQKMNQDYLKRLSNYYEKYYQDSVICVAPDEFLNAAQSMYNYKKWLSYHYFSKVCPVIQADYKYIINIKDLIYQADFYSEYSDIILFSNNALTGKAAKELKLERLFKYMKTKLNVKWIHVLGAGWDLDDIKEWLTIDYFDSLDSIAYYNDCSPDSALKNIENILEIIQ